MARRGAREDGTIAAPGEAALELALEAIEDLGGPAMLLDADLGVVAASPRAERLLGERVRPGTSAPRVLCGGAVKRPIAEALARGVAVAATVTRPGPDGREHQLVVRASPIERSGDRVGWVLMLGEERADDGLGEPVLFHRMWTRDPRMLHLFELITRAAQRDASVLVRGETGTGKELVARAIHELSPRKKGPYRAINCGALPPNLLESELFGHVRGAFTGAVRDSPGFFRSADGGTLFLDEVAEMPLDLQVKLLRVLETDTVIPVGGRDALPIDVRIVAATHTGLRKAVEEGTFRADLMYRLRVVPVFLPPLRERPGDVLLIAEKLMAEMNEEGGRRVLRIAPGARAVMERYAWPGNVRELRNVLEYAYVVGDGPVLVEADLPREVLDLEAGGEADAMPANTGGPPIENEPAEVARIRRAIERAGGNRERAARMLGMSRVTLWRHMRRLGLEGDETPT